ncbi:MAG TPA: sulfatase [Myxococcota bacterium]|nr:sulfatase [Myxococcota bacterium]
MRTPGFENDGGPARWRPFRRAGALVGLLLLVVGCGGEGAERGVADFDTRPPGTLEDLATLSGRDDLNVVFILIDTLRSDRMSAYGYERATTPTLDYFAKTGVRFARHRAQSSWTKTSMASLWTSLYPQRTGVLNYSHSISDEARMPAEIFREAGFTTVGLWRNGWVAPNFGFDQGFDYYQSPKARQAPSALRLKEGAGRIDGTDIDSVFSGIEFLRANQDRRFFLYIHMMDVHQYISTKETAVFGTTYSDAYDNSILWTDQQIALVLEALFDLDLFDRTLVVVASDHGEAFGEHGSEGHARGVHYEVVNTPFMIFFPMRLQPGIVVPAPTQNIDVFPTLFDLVGIERDRETDGKSRAPWLTGDRRGDKIDESYAQLDRSWGHAKEPSRMILGIREGPYRLIHHAHDPTLDRLYDVETDVGEFEDLAPRLGGTVERLRERAKDHLTLRTPWAREAPSVELDALHLRQLRALGYSIE